MINKKVYYFFYPRAGTVRFAKLRWTLAIIIQELLMCKFRAVIKYYVKPSYRKDINVLRDILSQGRMKGSKGYLRLGDIQFSHEINYPLWVEKMEVRMIADPDDYTRIKVIDHNGRWLVVDGNHRLMALRRTRGLDSKVRVLILSRA